MIILVTTSWHVSLAIGEEAAMDGDKKSKKEIEKFSYTTRIFLYSSLMPVRLNLPCASSSFEVHNVALSWDTIFGSLVTSPRVLTSHLNIEAGINSWLLKWGIF